MLATITSPIRRNRSVFFMIGSFVILALIVTMVMTPTGKNKNWTPQTRMFEGVEMVLVPQGCFILGRTDKQIAILSQQYPSLSGFFTNQGPQTKICFNNHFWIDKYLVTNAQFRQFNGIATQESYWTEDNRPRERISWFEAQDFCKLRGSRLPTEAEWEYAARGWDSLVYPWGNEWNPDNAVWSVYSGHEYPIDPSRQTAEVGNKLGGISWVGALDMSGNVWQWTKSMYRSYPYDKEDGRESNSDTTTPRVLRGGSWAYDEYYMQSTYRVFDSPSVVDNQIGFRCVRSSNGQTN